jgi:ankyrin repeat protein
MKEVVLKILNFKDIKPSIYNQVNNDKNSALIFACENNMKEVALKLLDFEDINYNNIDYYKNTALIFAC